MAKVYKNLWDRSKDGSRRELRSFIRYAIVLTALCFVFLLFKKDSIVTWVRSGMTARSQEKQIELLEERNAELENRIRNLRNSRDSLERFAREEYFFAEPGDDVYIVE